MTDDRALHLSLCHLDARCWRADLRCEGIEPGRRVRLVLRPEHASEDVPYGEWSVDARGRLEPLDLRSAVIFEDFEVEVRAVCCRTGRASNAVRLSVPSSPRTQVAVA